MNSVTLATLATWRSRNTGPAYVKVGGKVLYRVSDVEAYEAKNTRSK
jgi:predicted heme/steroid binding protein